MYNCSMQKKQKQKKQKNIATMGIEPMTLRLLGARSNRLS